jgi:WhiB family redox-sensing transcriptional regulator
MTETRIPLTAIYGVDDDSQLSWMDRALCAEVGDDFWFPEKGGSTRDPKRVCRSCEVRAECLEYALEHDERFGVWGGLSERERRQLKRAAVIRPQPEKTKPAPAPPRPPSSRFPGVTLKGNRWMARIPRPDGTREYLGSFTREADAARAVAEAESTQPRKAVA